MDGPTRGELGSPNTTLERGLQDGAIRQRTDDRSRDGESAPAGYPCAEERRAPTAPLSRHLLQDRSLERPSHRVNVASSRLAGLSGRHASGTVHETEIA